MNTLEYSSDKHNKLNTARRAYWVARYMLSEANKTPGRFDMSLWFWVLNRSRNELRRIAKEIRNGHSV